MKPHYRLYWSALTGIRGSAPKSFGEIDELQRRAWDEQGLMIVSRDDPRLTDGERIDLFGIGERLFRDGRHAFHPSRR